MPCVQTPLDVVVDDLGEAPELFLDGLCLLDKHFQHAVFDPLRQDEVVAAHFFGAGWSLRSMRPLRCSMRPGFQGRSKWKRSAQCAWKLRPSRAASVAIRMRSGSLAGSVLKRRWISLRRCAARESVNNLDPLLRPVRALDGLLEDCLQVALRALSVLRKDEHSPVLPFRRRALRSVHRMPEDPGKGCRGSSR